MGTRIGSVAHLHSLGPPQDNAVSPPVKTLKACDDVANDDVEDGRREGSTAVLGIGRGGEAAIEY